MVYLIVCNSYHLLDEEVAKIFPSLDDVEIIDYTRSSLTEIVESCGYISLFNDKKKIIVKNCNFLSGKANAETELLEKYLENPNPLTTIIFTFNDKVDERKKIIRLIRDQKHYINIKPLPYKEVANKLVEEAKKNKYKLSLSDATYISDASLNNIDIALLELEKVFLYYNKPCEIERHVLEHIISHSLDDNNFKFVDAVIKRKINEAIDYLKSFKLFKVEPLAVISLLAREYRMMLIAKSLYQKGYGSRTIATKLSIPDWKTDKIIANVSTYSIKELEDKVIDLSNLDYCLKMGKIEKYLGLEMFVLKG